MTERERPIGVDLFCGAGGMSLGFEQAGFDVVAAVDVDPIHVATHSKNFPECKTVGADLSSLSGADLRSQTELNEREIDIVFGGPPCGGFSIIGKRRVEDPRNELLGHFARLVDELGPRYFVVENVEGLLLDPMMGVFERFLGRVERMGYSTVSPVQTLVASDLGVPQRRRRVFVLGYRRGLAAPEYPESTRDGEDSPHHPTVWDAIGDLANLDKSKEMLKNGVYSGKLEPTDSRYAMILRGETCDPEDLCRLRRIEGDGLSGCGRIEHKAETIRRFERTYPGSYEPVSRFYRLTRDGLCPTLRAGTGKARGSYSAPRPIHPQHPRCITVREGARLHSYPDWFDFHHTKWHGFRQVGLSVPPLLGRAVAKPVRAAIERQLKENDDD